MKQPFLVPVLLLVGLCLLVVGIGWNRILPPAAYWGDEQAQEYAAAQADLHSISHSHTDDPAHEQEVAAAKERFIKSYQSLEYARTARNRTSTFFIAVGTMLILVGIVLHLKSGRSD